MFTDLKDLSAYQRRIANGILSSLSERAANPGEVEFLGLINWTSHYVFRVQTDVCFYSGALKDDGPAFRLSRQGARDFYELMARDYLREVIKPDHLTELTEGEQTFVANCTAGMLKDLGRKQVTFVGKVDGANLFLFVADEQLRAYEFAQRNATTVLSGNGVRELGRLMPRILGTIDAQAAEDERRLRRETAEKEIEEATARVRAEILKKHGLTE